MAQRRVSHLSFNFDSLTDLVTNLAGALIMIVLLFFFLSSKNVRDAAAGSQRPEGSFPYRISNVPALRSQTTDLGPRLKQKQDEVDRLKARVAEIDRDAAKVQPREFADPGGAPLKPALVDFRPPMLKVTDKKVAVTFVMLHDRVYFYKDSELSKAANEFIGDLVATLRAGNDTSAFEAGTLKRLQVGDFSVSFKVDLKKAEGGKPTELLGLRGTLVFKPEAKGESQADAEAANSNYHQLIQELDPDASLIEYNVYTDSFELFTNLRKPALKRRLNYKWSAYSAGQDVTYNFNLKEGAEIAY